MILDNIPLVSVIIPSYNHEKYIENCIKSVKDQTYKKIQLIIVDDGSTDNSVNLINKCIEDIEFQTVFIKKKNEGLTKTLNRGLENIKGEYICFLASDDIWASDKIMKQVLFMMKNPRVGLVFTDALFIKKNIITSIKYSKYKTKLRTMFNNNRVHDNLYYTLLVDNIIPSGSVMIKANLLSEIGNFDENLSSEDFDFWLRVAKSHSIGYIDEPLFYYRLHDSNLSKNSVKMIIATYQTLKKQFDEVPLKNLPFKRAKIIFMFYANILIYKTKKIIIRKREKDDI